MSVPPLPDRSTTAASTTFYLPRPVPRHRAVTTSPAGGIGRYQVTGYLGSGTFLVYRAYDDLEGRQVAIKIDRAPAQAASSCRWPRPRSSADHPRIVKFYDYVPDAGERRRRAGDNDGDGFIVMEYIEVGPWRGCSRTTPCPPRLARIVAQVTDAHHAHTQRPGLIHRDLKLQTSSSTFERAARLRLRPGRRRGRPVVPAGRGPETLLYMAPEQVRGEIHRLDGGRGHLGPGRHPLPGLTGGHPFPHRKDHSVFEEHPPPRPQASPHVRRDRPGAGAICLRCLIPDVRRYLTAADLAADLMATIDRRPAGPRPAPDRAPGAAVGVEDARSFLMMLRAAGRDGLPETIRFWEMRRGVRGDLAFPVGLLYGPSGGESSFVRARACSLGSTGLSADHHRGYPSRDRGEVLTAATLALARDR
ncbi:MAG: hypothetical protein WKF75_02760 [Singulisphaera sp.]